ncbi:efflux RND transporter periplasmic adaptor subunit [Candidatus Poribacteria bacterium]|nr:efflux RND transporter periplasmic adaptor subunit [Candidatus Poribacteria bacterium]
MTRRIWGYILISTLMLLSFPLAHAQPPMRGGAGMKLEKLVAVSKPKVGEIRREITLVGSVEPDRKVKIVPKASGRIERILVDEGQIVKKGDPLAVIEHVELDLGVKQALAALKSAEAALEQARKLAKIKAESQLKQAKAALIAAQVGLEQVKDISEASVQARIRQAEAGLDALKANLEKIKRGARPEEIKRMESMVEQAKAALDNARENYERMSALYEQEVISKQTMDGAEMQYKVAKAQYEAALQQLTIVKKGAREEDIRAMEAQVRSAEANLKLAKLYAQTRSWEKDLKLAESRVQQAQAAYDLAKASFDAETWRLEITTAESRYEQAKAALDLARQRLKDATVTAPFDGVIVQRMVDEGAMVAPGVGMFSMVKMDKVKIVTTVSESEIPYLKEGMPVLIKTVTGSFQGKVDYVSPVVDPTSRSVRIKIYLDNAQGKLKPGMSADVVLPIEVHRNVLLVPRTALLNENGSSFLFVVRNGKAVKRAVEVGLTDEWNAEITEGITEKDLVVVAGGNQLEDGDVVKVKGR